MYLFMYVHTARVHLYCLTCTLHPIDAVQSMHSLHGTMSLPIGVCVSLSCDKHVTCLPYPPPPYPTLLLNQGHLGFEHFMEALSEESELGCHLYLASMLRDAYHKSLATCELHFFFCRVRYIEY